MSIKLPEKQILDFRYRGNITLGPAYYITAKTLDTKIETTIYFLTCNTAIKHSVFSFFPVNKTAEYVKVFSNILMLFHTYGCYSTTVILFNGN
jgi:hypothetical protein